ncbi:hypothetical protein [Haloferula sp. BvORR071]|uniref:hypothetical protein n=1 Tax=Haloferula sp. BvORR071 TaxID=1396141 RepID=UPI0005585D30|nr:hypothetical protein [Haloferula sp. BvORR071]
MSLFDRFKKSPPAPSTAEENAALRDKLVNLVFSGVRSEDNRIRVEDAVGAAAVIVAERCIDAVGTPPLRDHELTPGSRVLSDPINGWICGDELELAKIPVQSVVGTLRVCLNGVYADSEFPDVKEAMTTFLNGISQEGIEWGRAPLSVGKDHEPFILPLRVGYETRGIVDQVLGPVLEDKARCVTVATLALAAILQQVAGAIDHKLVLTLALETVNGMAKTAPMTEKAMKEASKEG